MLRRVFNKSLTQPNYGILPSCRNLTMHTINDNLYLCTEKPRSIEIDKKSLRLKQIKENTKPLVLIISWFYGQKSQINKYSELYTNQGCDVLVGRMTTNQVLLSVKSIEKFGENIADILVENKKEYPEIFIHSFSAGASMWGVVQRVMERNVEKYSDVPNRVVGQIWDSVAYPTKLMVAIPYALFPNNIFMQYFVKVTLWLLINIHVKMIRHMYDAFERFSNNLVRGPALFISSKVDPINTPDEIMEDIFQKWRKNGVDVTYKCFEDTPHVKHFQKYPEEYLKLVHNLWEKAKMLEKQ